MEEQTFENFEYQYTGPKYSVLGIDQATGLNKFRLDSHEFEGTEFMFTRVIFSKSALEEELSGENTDSIVVDGETPEDKPLAIVFDFHILKASPNLNIADKNFRMQLNVVLLDVIINWSETLEKSDSDSETTPEETE